MLRALPDLVDVRRSIRVIKPPKEHAISVTLSDAAGELLVEASMDKKKQVSIHPQHNKPLNKPRSLRWGPGAHRVFFGPHHDPTSRRFPQAISTSRVSTFQDNDHREHPETHSYGLLLMAGFSLTG